MRDERKYQKHQKVSDFLPLRLSSPFSRGAVSSASPLSKDERGKREWGEKEREGGGGGKGRDNSKTKPVVSILYHSRNTEEGKKAYLLLTRVWIMGRGGEKGGKKKRKPKKNKARAWKNKRKGEDAKGGKGGKGGKG